MTTRRRLYDDVHEEFRDGFRAFVAAEIVPHHDRWEENGRVDREMFAAAGEGGFLAMAVPSEHGGLGVDDFRFNAVISEELQRANVIGSGMCITLHNDVVLPYLPRFADEAQRRRWLPGTVTGELMGAISMTEPGAGSDLAALVTSARRDGDDYVVNGAKTFVTNGLNADLVVLAVRTDPAQRHRGVSLLLFFTDARVPVANPLGGEGEGFAVLMRNLAQERLGLAVSAIAAARAALSWTVDYCHQREAHGGYGFMREFPIARAYLDARIQTVFGGTNEIMKEIVARTLDGAGR